MAHYKRKRPRTKGDREFGDYKHMVRRAGGEENVRGLYSRCPRGWNIEHHIRPRRRETRHLEQLVLRGEDPDGIAWPLPGKPYIYYW